MIQVVKSNERGTSQMNWLKSYHSFSFNQWYDPRHVQFGPLRVLNEDWVMPKSGFGMHPHHDMEIITYVLEGELEHQDSTGSKGVIHSGEVQRMSAGTGIFHSEMNNHQTDTVHLLQIWFLPDRNGYEPSYEQMQFTKEQRTNTLLQVASNQKNGNTVFIKQDLSMFVSNLEMEKHISIPMKKERLGYLFLIDGKISIGKHDLHTGDAVKISEEDTIDIAAKSEAEFVLFDMCA